MPLSPASMVHALLAALLIAAAVVDLRTRRIPNPLIAASLACAALAHALSLGAGTVPLAGPSWWSPLAGFTAGLLLMLPLHLLRAMGAGDVKLMAMVGAFIGAPAVLHATLYALLAGGVLSLFFMLGRGIAAETLTNLRLMISNLGLAAGSRPGIRAEPLQKTAARLPYALPIAVGTAIALIWPASL